MRKYLALITIVVFTVIAAASVPTTVPAMQGGMEDNPGVYCHSHGGR